MSSISRQLNNATILRLMCQIEDIHNNGKCFHEMYPELDAKACAAIDGKGNASFIINEMSKLVDKLQG